MPVRFDRDDYSFQLGDHGARDYARSRRFGDEEPEDSRTMSLVSSPLQLPVVGQRRSGSPGYRSSPAPQQQQQMSFDDDDYDEEIKYIQQQNRQAMERRRRIEYDDIENDSLEPLVPTYQRRTGGISQRSNQQRTYSPSRYTPRRQQRHQVVEQFDDEFDDVELPQNSRRQQRQPEMSEERQTPPKQQPLQKKDDLDLEDIFQWKKKRAAREAQRGEDLGYTVPPLRKRPDILTQEEDEGIRSAAGYIAKRRQFAVEDEDEMHYYKNPNYQYRVLTGDMPVISAREVEESIDRSKLDRAPMFDMKLRSHQVWEKMNVKFTCTVRGHPQPRVTWYRDMVPIEPSLNDPGKFKITNNYSLHTLEICRASVDDSGTYRVSVQNRKGEISSYATLLVRRYEAGRAGFVDMKSGYNLKKPTDYPDVQELNVPDTKPHAGSIEAKEYDELPDTEAARQFRSQLENLDFDVKQLIKEAKLEKSVAASDNAVTTSQEKHSDDVQVTSSESSSAEASKPAKRSVTFSEDLVIPPRKSSDVSLSSDVMKRENSSKTVSSSSERIVKSDLTSSSDATEQNRFKVAIEFQVTNEGRRDSLERMDKTVQLDVKPTVIEA